MSATSPKPHVFVAFSDITKLRCDAWLFPTDAGLHITRGWRPSSSARAYIDSVEFRSAWDPSHCRSAPTLPWHPAVGSSPAPIPILTDVGGFRTSETEWYLEGLRSFAATADRVTQKNPSWRSKRLFAVPLIGTGEGGKRLQTGEMEFALLEELEKLSANKAYDADFVLVLREESSYTSTQAVRRQRSVWPLDDRQRDELDGLADRARRGELVLFIGAGMSQAAGLPSWSSLLSDLAVTAKISDPRQLNGLSDLDVASLLERRIGVNQFRQEVARLTTSSCFGLGHALSAALPIPERVTTNYDNCIEDSLEALHRKVSVLPYHPTQAGEGWLLKLHGTLEASEDIVLTRQDYLRYESRRGALYGIVQAQLLTRHLLFLGFSLKDPNFLALFDEVRSALENVRSQSDERSDHFGTVFVPPTGELASELWQNEVSVRVLGTDETYGRDLEILLDYLAFSTATSLPHLFEQRYDAILTEDERELKALLLDVQEKIPQNRIGSPAFAPLVNFMRGFGSKIGTHAANDGHANPRDRNG